VLMINIATLNERREGSGYKRVVLSPVQRTGGNGAHLLWYSRSWGYTLAPYNIRRGRSQASRYGNDDTGTSPG
jgi:hypothetical protein